jgi:hypothetical protein
MTLAKQMFILGQLEGTKNTKVDRILAILNFDFCVVTLIASACISSKENPKQKNGKAKRWDELLSTLSRFYKNEIMISDLDSLHDLRNAVQHGDTIPSEWDVERFAKLVRSFFDDICNEIYQQSITFDNVSIAQIVKSPHERTLLTHMEEQISKKNYSIAYIFLFTSALYHYMLIRTNLKIPLDEPYSFGLNPNEINDTLARRNIKNLYERMQQIASRLAMGEFYLRTIDLLKKSELTLSYAYDSISKLEPLQNATFEQIEEDKTTLYGIILGTEHIVTEKEIVDAPIVYGTYSFDITSTNTRINYGILNKLEIENCEAKLYVGWDESQLLKTIELPNTSEYRTLELDNLNPNTKYSCIISATQEGDPEFKGNRSVSTTKIKFQTK